MPRKSPSESGKAAPRNNSRGYAPKTGTVTVSLRIPVAMLQKIDDAVASRPYKTPRHLWLLEAIYEKLTRSRQLDGGA